MKLRTGFSDREKGNLFLIKTKFHFVCANYHFINFVLIKRRKRQEASKKSLNFYIIWFNLLLFLFCKRVYNVFKFDNQNIKVLFQRAHICHSPSLLRSRNHVKYNYYIVGSQPDLTPPPPYQQHRSFP